MEKGDLKGAAGLFFSEDGKQAIVEKGDSLLFVKLGGRNPIIIKC